MPQWTLDRKSPPRSASLALEADPVPPPLPRQAIQHERLRLAHEMVTLALRDAQALPESSYALMQDVVKLLTTVLHQTHQRP